MSEDLEVLETWVAGALQDLSPAARRALHRAVAIDVRRANFERIAAQRNPDGTPYEPRKPRDPPLRAKAGRIKRRAQARKDPMFRKLRLSRHLTAQWTDSGASIGFSGRAARVAQVHQDGLMDKVDRRADAPTVRYARRQLLGFTEEDRRRLLDRVIAHLDKF